MNHLLYKTKTKPKGFLEDMLAHCLLTEVVKCRTDSSLFLPVSNHVYLQPNMLSAKIY